MFISYVLKQQETVSMGELNWLGEVCQKLNQKQCGDEWTARLLCVFDCIFYESAKKDGF